MRRLDADHGGGPSGDAANSEGVSRGVDAFVRLDVTKKGKTHVLEWKLYREDGEVRAPLSFRPQHPGAPAFSPEMMLSYLFLWGLRGAGPVFLHHQEWDLERDDLEGGVWRRPTADVSRLSERFPTRRIEWELTGRIIAGRGPLAVRAWWEQNPMVLAGPPTWAHLSDMLSAGSGRDAVVRTAWFLPVSPTVTLNEMGHHIDERGEAGAPPWPLPKGCALLVYAEHGQDQGYRSALQFVCKNAGMRDRVLHHGAQFNAFLSHLAAAGSEAQFHAMVDQWAAAIHLPPVPVGGQSGDE